jgi:hypothetical protein
LFNEPCIETCTQHPCVQPETELPERKTNTIRFDDLSVKLGNQSPLAACEELVDLLRVDIGEHLNGLALLLRLPGLRRGAGAVEHLRPRRRAVEEEVVEEAALRREQRSVGGPVPLRRGGEEVVGEQRMEEARRIGTREADHGAGGQARGQHARVLLRARVEVSGEAARERRHGWARYAGSGHLPIRHCHLAPFSADGITITSLIVKCAYLSGSTQHTCEIYSGQHIKY